MTIRIVQVGLGVRGIQWARVIREDPRTLNVAYVRQRVDVARAQVKEWGEDAPCFASLEDALEDVRADAVLLVTPPEGHHGQALTAFSHGCHVLAEKPLAEDMSEAIDIVRQAERHGLQLMVGMNFRYLATSQALRRIFQEQAFGAPGFGQFTYLRNRDGKRPDLNKYPLTMRQPMLLEQSVHHLDLMRYVYSADVTAVSAHTWRPNWSTYDDDCCVSALLQFRRRADGLALEANYMGTWTAGWNRFTFRWRTDCTAGVVIQNAQFEDLRVARLRPGLGMGGVLFKTGEDVEPLEPYPLPPCEPFIDDTRGLLDEFVNALEDRALLATTGKDHLKTLGLTVACIESSQTGQRVYLPDFHRRQGVPARWLDD
jgi:myo-inositol 2-dehydrogenase / D-chiro-inositol 1-dehydrogenase